MPESTVLPKRIEVRRAKWAGQALYLDIYVRENAGTKTVTAPDGSQQALYTYDEVQVRVPAPARLRAAGDFSAAAHRHGSQRALKLAIHKAMKAQTVAGGEVRQALADALTPATLRQVNWRDEARSLPAGVRTKIKTALASQAEWAKGPLVAP